MSAPPVEVARFLTVGEMAAQQSQSFKDSKVDIFIKSSSAAVKTVRVPLTMSIRDFIGIVVSATGIVAEQLDNFRICWAGIDMRSIDAQSMTLAAFGLSRLSTVHINGMLRGCNINEFHAKMRNYDKLVFSCMEEMGIEYVEAALKRYNVDYSFAQSFHPETKENVLREMLIQYSWATFT